MIGSSSELDLAPDAGGVRIDEVQLQQLLLNLVLNARDAMPAGGAAHARRRGAIAIACEVAVSDTGIGMTDELRARIFEPFFTTKDAASGTGLGLATVADIVRQAGGTIDVTSAPGQGTTFRLSFPRAEAARHAAAAGRQAPAGRCRKVLLIDDDELVAARPRGPAAALGLRVIATRSADDALAIRAIRSIDALVTDIVMPRTSGFAIADALRALRPAAKVLYLSGYGELPAERIGDGASFLAKPFSAAELLRGLRTLLDPQLAAHAELLHARAQRVRVHVAAASRRRSCPRCGPDTGASARSMWLRIASSSDGNSLPRSGTSSRRTPSARAISSRRPSPRIAARSITAASSRTLPGQS